MSTVLIATVTLMISALQMAEVRGVVVDVSGAPVPDAVIVVVVNGQEQPVAMAADGTFSASASGGELKVSAPGFTDVVIPLADAGPSPLRIVLQPASFAESVV